MTVTSIILSDTYYNVDVNCKKIVAESGRFLITLPTLWVVEVPSEQVWRVLVETDNGMIQTFHAINYTAFENYIWDSILPWG